MLNRKAGAHTSLTNGRASCFASLACSPRNVCSRMVKEKDRSENMSLETRAYLLALMGTWIELLPTCRSSTPHRKRRKVHPILRRWPISSVYSAPAGNIECMPTFGFYDTRKLHLNGNFAAL